jgi:hypothetical protein
MDFYPSSKLWRPGMPNGHSNSCLGGTGTSKVDLFNANRGGVAMGAQDGCLGPGVAGPYNAARSPYYNTCADGGPPIPNGWYPDRVTDTDWYAAGVIGHSPSVPGGKAHNFTCSKCHNPHASGLPALLIQNCIDPSIGGVSVGTAAYANNCHRKESARDSGWHYLAPGQ